MPSSQNLRAPNENSSNNQWKLVGQLRSEDPVYRKFSSLAAPDVVERSRRSQFGSEIISMAWSPDSNIFAWSVGSNLVCLHHISQFLSDAASNSGDGGDMAGSHDKAKSGLMSELDCGSPVTSLCFGSRESDVKWQKGQVKYNRFEEQVKNQLILAVGLATGDVKIWEVASGKLMTVLKDHKGAVTDLHFAPDGSLVLVSASKDSTVKLWNLLDDGNMFRTLEREDAIAKKTVKNVCWSPDAKKLVAVGDSKLAVIYEMDSFTLQTKLQGHQHDVTGCVFSDDGKEAFTSSYDTRVKCWNVADGNLVRNFEHMSPPPSAIFAAGTNDHEVIDMDMRGQFLATVCHDGMLRIWNVRSKDESAVYKEDIVPEGHSVVFADNGHTIAVGCQGGIVQFFRNA